MIKTTHGGTWVVHVQVKGRRSGHLAVTASLASGVVDAVLVPEVRFKLEGPGSLLEHIEHLLESQGHAVVCVAEGAGQEHIPDGACCSWLSSLL